MTDLRISGASSNPRNESDISLNHGDQNKIIAAANDRGTFRQAVLFPQTAARSGIRREQAYRWHPVILCRPIPPSIGHPTE